MKYFFLLFVAGLMRGSSLSSLVVGVADGDTITLRELATDPRAQKYLGKNLRIRLQHVDCPEKGEPFYQVAKQYTAQLCFQKKVSLIHQNRYDRYGRLLAEVILPDGRILNQELVKAGYAKHFKKYSSSAVYAGLEVKARSQRLGIWAVD
jgi:micrococcal nuclease